MAYAAVISLKQTIEHLLYSPHVVNPVPQILQSLYEDVSSLQELLKELDSSSNTIREKVNANLDGQIRDSVYEFEDILDTHASNEKLEQEIDSFTETVKKMKKAYIEELHTEEDDDEDDGVSQRIDFSGGSESKMVGFSAQFDRVKAVLLKQDLSVTVSLNGMAGIGKTTLAKKILQDPLILSHFDRCVFVTLGPKYRFKRIAENILSQINSESDEVLVEGDDSDDEAEYDSADDMKILVVLDDVWESKIWGELVAEFPDDIHQCRFLVTTRLRQVGESYSPFLALEMPFLNKEESWELLRHKVFDEMPCPPLLEKVGKKIAENCEGLPLAIVIVGDILSESEKTVEYWNKVANREVSVFVDAYDQMFDTLYPSYEYLPQHLKSCFLYMGVFPEKYEIPLSRFTKLWDAEGFSDQDQNRRSEYIAHECLHDLLSRNLIRVQKESSYKGIKSYGQIHSSYWYLCNKVAPMKRFFHGLNSIADSLAEGIESQRRLCIRNNVLFGIKDAYDSMGSVSSARSLLCTGPYHQYPVPICFGLMLLRVLDALSIRFYEFPLEVLKLIQLRYLSLTCDGDISNSMSELRNLRWLIVDIHQRIKSPGAPSYLPMDIWHMQELEHLQITGTDLPNPCEGSLLPKLSTLLDVSARSCTKRVLERIPNLKKLGIRIELTSDNVDDQPLSCFDHISHLDKLRSLKCVVVNPGIMFDIVGPPFPLSIFPSNLAKLTLSGLGNPWEEITSISSLPYLKVLKLRCYAFRGTKWEVYDNGFPWLENLLIEDADLAQWSVGSGSFPKLKSLTMKHCYKLRELPVEFAKSLRKIDLIECNPLVLTCAKKIKEDGNLFDFSVMISDKYGWELELNF
ncbi:hypothetical protein MIMGU_mgv1a001245mg [Erythranthe guttata]|uniref:Uncharacterized protein n=1 Tax=Erythranthe guttata TaxID=4155 RepID=A0A022PS94_ERYGU|nr:hypothetical protein MIMGU_mgv1a001245mg [Erythranthe guttata]